MSEMAVSIQAISHSKVGKSRETIPKPLIQ
jgi:hypothetical protein